MCSGECAEEPVAPGVVQECIGALVVLVVLIECADIVPYSLSYCIIEGNSYVIATGRWTRIKVL